MNGFLIRLVLLLSVVNMVSVQAETIRPLAMVCNDLVYLSLDANCTEPIRPDMVLEGTYPDYSEYLVELDRTLPFGNGPWVPALVNAADIDQTYNYRVTHVPTGEMLADTQRQSSVACFMSKLTSARGL